MSGRHLWAGPPLSSTSDAILLERGVIFPAGRRKLALGLDGMLAQDDTALSPRVR